MANENALGGDNAGWFAGDVPVRQPIRRYDKQSSEAGGVLTLACPPPGRVHAAMNASVMIPLQKTRGDAYKQPLRATSWMFSRHGNVALADDPLHKRLHPMAHGVKTRLSSRACEWARGARVP